MLVIATHIEEMKPHWREFDSVICENLERTFGIDLHYYIGGKPGDRFWFDSLRSKGHKVFIEHLGNIYTALGEKFNYVNVQPPRIFERFNMEWQWLHEYEHPFPNVCYIFGSNQQAITVGSGDNVAIDLIGSSLFSFCAAAIVLYDRSVKGGSSTGRAPDSDSGG